MHFYDNAVKTKRARKKQKFKDDDKEKQFQLFRMAMPKKNYSI